MTNLAFELDMILYGVIGFVAGIVVTLVTLVVLAAGDDSQALELWERK